MEQICAMCRWNDACETQTTLDDKRNGFCSEWEDSPKPKPSFRIHPNNEEIWFIDAPKGYKVVLFDHAESSQWVVVKLEKRGA
jgi:hypothetical protein